MTATANHPDERHGDEQQGDEQRAQHDQVSRPALKAKGNVHAENSVEQPQVSFYRDPTFDAILDSLFELSAEVWAGRRRSAVLEALLVDNGVIAPDEIDAYVLDTEQEVAMAQKRQDLVERLYQPFLNYTG